MAAVPETPYERIGGEPVVRNVVERFYERMDSDPAVGPLRAMHAADLGPMRDRLGDFMVGWLGGPPLYSKRPDARCMGQAHAAFANDASIRDQWLSCMRGALEGEGIAPDLQGIILEALGRMTEAMRNR